MSLPVTLQPSIGRALVVGGGAVAARKVRALRAGGFEVTVVAPEIMHGIAGVGVVLIERRFQADDLHDHAILVCSTHARQRRRDEPAVGIALKAAVHGLQVANTCPLDSSRAAPSVR